MILYDPIIRQTENLTGKSAPKSYSYDPENCLEEADDYEIILKRDTAYELGGDGCPSASFTCVTTDPSFFAKAGASDDEILLYGPDLSQIRKPSAYALITLLLTTDIESDDENDTETAYRAVQSMDFVKYHVYPKGFMVRTSSRNNREQVRVSRKAIADGISFEQVGNTFIRHYKENESVRKVKLIFVTAPDADYKGLAGAAKKTADITKSLSKILEGMPTECSICGIRDICDEIEGLKELHFGQKK